MSKRSATGRPGAARQSMNPEEDERLLVYEYDRGSNYEEDTRLTTALSALLPENELVHPDQRLFQTVHLITEFAWCEMHFEMRRAIDLMRAGDQLMAAQVLERAADVGDIPLTVLTVLVEHLPQRSLLAMRATFPENTTGLDSPGARNLRRAAVPLWQEFMDALHRAGLTTEDLIEAQGRLAAPAEEDRAAAELALVRKAMLRLDGAVVYWKQRHLRMVWSQLGGHPESRHGIDEAECPGMPTSLRGQSISALRAMSERTLFPALWDSVDATYRKTVPVGGTSW
ncbi:hypothetical protein [Streptomyces rubellomurinus]|uniref:Tryptophan 2,3-dioxygenase n=2 Tax=Streptomyces TaxID=1883 RepID=A0A0F2T520_STRR3|nr:hypothetical protein [Streptomyces rubellomurinus]KJS54254.1 hypothetical protein VM98_20155 [Streptomyces rubellomurinus subsp. indigoferus]KJS58298.1 hypothetical protein VM95_34185 [Streptomyces rubellomurinus]